MGIFGKLSKYFYERNLQGDNYYWVGSGNSTWNDLGNKMETALNSPILMPAINFIAERFANAKFYIEKKNGEITQDHPLIKLLENPNPDQSKNEFLKSFIWNKTVYGFVYVYKKFEIGFNYGSLYNLDSSCIKYPSNYKTKMLFNDEQRDVNFIYNCDQEKLNINIKDIIPFYDLPNGTCDNFLLTAPSRLDALKKPINTIDLAYDAKNRVLPQNGDRLWKHAGKEFSAMMPDEKKDIENKLNNGYGLGKNRSKNIVTNSNISTESLHINLSDLGLDESIIKDFEKIILGLGIPIDGLKYDPKKSTFENQIQSETSFYQNRIGFEMEDFTNSLTTDFLKEEGSKLIAKYDHLPLFQKEKNKELNTLEKKINVLNSLIELGVDTDQAVKLAQLNDLTINKKSKDNE